MLGLVLSLLVSVLLAERGLLFSSVEILLILILCFLGFAIGWRVDQNQLRASLRESVPAVAVVFLIAVLTMLLPGRGSWIKGGWDPGVYLNQGIHVAKTGTFHPEPATSPLTRLPPSDHEFFTRGEGDYVECFPGCPVDPNDGSLQTYFFRLMPAMVSILYRSGGLRAASGVNDFVGLLAAFIFLSALLHCCRRSGLSFLATAALLIQPVWLYHLHVPLPEMLQLLLVSGLLLMVPDRSENIFSMAVVCVLLFAAVLNRVSFVVFGSAFLVALAWLDLQRADRIVVIMERFFQILALAIAADFDIRVTAVSVLRLSYIVPRSMAVASVLLAVAVLLDLFALTRYGRRWLVKVLHSSPPAVLARLEAEGVPVYFLTSTPEALGIYPGVIADARETWASDRLPYREIIHHPKQNTFALKESSVEFRLYRW